MQHSSSPTIPIIEGLRSIVDRYDGFILDLWGVLHDGVRAYPDAVDALRHLKAAGKRSVILSNGPRRAAAVARRTTEIGIAPDLYDGLHSSGEATWQALRERRDPAHAALGKRPFLIAAARDRDLLDGLELEPAADVGDAGFILVTGLADAAETLADYESILAAGARLRRPMLCANPDLEVIRGGVRELCAGALAARYEALGGGVLYHGKPYPSVYGICFAMLDGIERPRILAVGDSLRTDIAGARNVGIDSLLITGGIHAEELAEAAGRHPDPVRLAAACARARQWPSFAAPLFAW